MGVISDGRFWGGVLIGVLAFYGYGRWRASKTV